MLRHVSSFNSNDGFVEPWTLIIVDWPLRTGIDDFLVWFSGSISNCWKVSSISSISCVFSISSPSSSSSVAGGTTNSL
jgi:hypothetical protein